MTAHTASNVLAICTPRSVKPAKNLLQVLVEESTFHLRTGNGTSHASPALVAPYRWWAQASSPSKMRFSVVTATAAYRTQPLATHLTFPYARIHIHAHIYFTQLCPQMRTSHLKLRPCRYCCLRSQQTNNLLPHTHTIF